MLSEAEKILDTTLSSNKSGLWKLQGEKYLSDIFIWFYLSKWKLLYFCSVSSTYVTGRYL